jgi:hypothetical protein
MSLYEIVNSQYNEFKRKGMLAEYKETLSREKYSTSNALTKFLYSPTMQVEYPMESNDEKGWVMYKELADKYAVLQYFETRKQ